MAEFYVTLRILVEGMAGVFSTAALIWGGVTVLRKIGK